MTNVWHSGSLLLLVTVLPAACQRPSATTVGVLGDSTYVATMAELQRIHDERTRTPMPPVPMVPGPDGNAATPAAQRRRDSVVRHRADSIVGVDSVKRAVIFARYKVTVGDLETTARVLARDPARMQRYYDAIYRRVASLDAAANQAKAQAAKAAGHDPSPPAEDP